MPRNPRYLKDFEVEKLLSYLNARHNIDLSIALGLFLGMRINEIYHVKRTDIKLSLRTGMFTVRKEVAKYNKQRVIPVCPILGEMLKTYYLCHDTFNVKNLSLWNCSLRTVQRRFKAYFDHLNLKCTPHDLRHTFAAALYGQCKDLSLVMAALGHRSLSSTLVYTHVNGMLQQEINKAYEGYVNPPERQTYNVRIKQKGPSRAP